MPCTLGAGPTPFALLQFNWTSTHAPTETVTVSHFEAPHVDEP